MPLDPEQQRILEAAEGYLHLGMLLDANEELENLDPFVRHLPEVLRIRLAIYKGLRKWELAQTVAQRLIREDSDDPQMWVELAEITRNAESIEAGRVILFRAIKLHPDSAIIHYNLGRFACLMDDLSAAREHLSRAFTLDKRLRLRALDDEDLQRLWDEL